MKSEAIMSSAIHGIVFFYSNMSSHASKKTKEWYITSTKYTGWTVFQATDEE